MNRGAWWATVHAITELDTATEQLTLWLSRAHWGTQIIAGRALAPQIIAEHPWATAKWKFQVPGTVHHHNGRQCVPSLRWWWLPFWKCPTSLGRWGIGYQVGSFGKMPGQVIEWLPWQGRARAHSKGGAVQKPMWIGPATARKVGNPPPRGSGHSCSGHSQGWRVKVHSRQLGVGSCSGASQAGSTPRPRVQPPLAVTGPSQATPACRVPQKACHLRCAGLFRPSCLLLISVPPPPNLGLSFPGFSQCQT